MTTPLRAVIAGCGAMSKAWLEVTREIPDFQMVGFVDLNEAAAQASAEVYGSEGSYIGKDLQEALTQKSPDIVFDCTIPEAHSAITLAALKHGCHVLGEKPLAASMDEARAMVKAAEASGKIYAVIQNRRYDRNIRRLKTYLQTGAIGKITTINCDFYVGAHFGGFRNHMEHVLLLDMAIHTFDAARYLSDSDAISVYCKEWNPAGSWYEHDASAIALFEMTDDIVYTYRGSWCAEGLRTTWESDWRIIGERGSVRWDGGENIQAQVVTQSGGFFSSTPDVEVPEYAPDDYTNGHRSIIHEFVNSVRTGQTPMTICTDNIKSLAMVFAAIESAEKGLPVSVE